MKRLRKGLTVVELVIAMFIMALIATSAAGVFMVLSTAYSQSEANYNNLQALRSAILKIQEELNKAKLITAAQYDRIVYWTSDTNRDGRINLSELAEIRLDRTDLSIEKHQVVFPDGMDPLMRAALDYRVPLWAAMDVHQTTGLIENSLYHDSRVLAENVRDFYVNARPECPKAKLVTIRIAIGSETGCFTISNAATMRADRTGDIGISDGQFVLDPGSYYDDDGNDSN